MQYSPYDICRTETLGSKNFGISTPTPAITSNADSRPKVRLWLKVLLCDILIAYLRLTAVRRHRPKKLGDTRLQQIEMAQSLSLRCATLRREPRRCRGREAQMALAANSSSEEAAPSCLICTDCGRHCAAKISLTAHKRTHSRRYTAGAHTSFRQETPSLKADCSNYWYMYGNKVAWWQDVLEVAWWTRTVHQPKLHCTRPLIAYLRLTAVRWHRPRNWETLACNRSKWREVCHSCH